jgi:hypothetical protein
MYDNREYTPTNYGDEYDGVVTYRRALAMSRNVAAVKVAEAAGFDRVASVWRSIGAGAAARPYPSIALGVFEASPLEIARAYTPFADLGLLRHPRPLPRLNDHFRNCDQGRCIVRQDVIRTVYLNAVPGIVNEGDIGLFQAVGVVVDRAPQLLDIRIPDERDSATGDRPQEVGDDRRVGNRVVEMEVRRRAAVGNADHQRVHRLIRLRRGRVGRRADHQIERHDGDADKEMASQHKHVLAPIFRLRQLHDVPLAGNALSRLGRAEFINNPFNKELLTPSFSDLLRWSLKWGSQ